MNKVAENISTYEYTTKIMPGVSFPVWSTFVELMNNELMIISPGPFEQSMIEETINQYSHVYCVAPNAFHHKYLEGFNALFPGIDMYGPSSLAKKQPWLTDKLLRLEALAEQLKDQVLLFPIQGNSILDETVFYCCRSKSLIVTDLIFNMRDPMPLGRKCMLKLVGAHNKIAQSKMVKNTTKDEEAYVNSVKPLGELDCQRIIVGHGDLIEGNDIKEALTAMGAVEV